MRNKTKTFILVTLLATSILLYFKVSASQSFTHDIAQCEAKSPLEKEICFEKLIAHTAVSAPLATVLSLYETIATQKTTECHSLGHKIGKIIYDTQKSDTSSLFTHENKHAPTLCGWGFWHGYMTRYTQDHKATPSTLNAFCTSLDPAFDATYDCFHGIGLGAVGDPPEPEHWGKQDELIQKALSLCDRISVPTYLDTCYQGAFHQMIDFMDKQAFNFVHPDTAYPFAFCQSQQHDHQHACFLQMAPSIFWRLKTEPFTNQDIFNPLKTLSFYSEIVRAAMIGTVNSVYFDGDRNTLLTRCINTTQINNACIEGILHGEISKGNKETQKNALTAWCATLDNDTHIASCHAHLLTL